MTTDDSDQPTQRDVLNAVLHFQDLIAGAVGRTEIDVRDLRSDMRGVTSDIATLKSDVSVLKSDMQRLERRVIRIDDRLSAIENLST